MTAIINFHLFQSESETLVTDIHKTETFNVLIHNVFIYKPK